MASYRKRGKVWYYRYINADGVKREAKGCTDRRATEDLARAAESQAAKVRAGLIDPRELALREAGKRPIEEHVGAFAERMVSKGGTAKHADETLKRIRRLTAIVKGAAAAEVTPPPSATRADLARFEAALTRWTTPAKLADLTADRVQQALRSLVEGGASHRTANASRIAIKSFTRWAVASGRLAFDPLAGVTSFNERDDRRHDRRTLGTDDLRRFVEAAHRGPDCMGTTGPERALLYRLAVATGLRYSELQSIRVGSFDWRADPVTVTVRAGDTKNGQSATLSIPDDLADDLRPFVAAVSSGDPVFKLPAGKGAKLIRRD